MTTNIVIIGMTEIMQLYGFTRKEATKLLSIRGCPVLPREKGAPYRLIKDEFEKWLRTRSI